MKAASLFMAANPDGATRLCAALVDTIHEVGAGENMSTVALALVSLCTSFANTSPCAEHCGRALGEAVQLATSPDLDGRPPCGGHARREWQ